ncbi:MAG: CDP-alcohol phosphatidyltransferase family protein [Caldilineaceae bacterium]|nr:CDP-alcohol phosphatidyltransferase family protein [Caldilineaceae bacterium]MCB9148804.1 CDP-alcohol phosphatidyltransferase family protein [Caldilineaceae bacterium]
MRDSVLREQKDKLMLPVAEQLFSAIHPNVLSFIALGIGLLSAAAIWQQAYWAGLGFWILNRVIDGLDGLVARVHHKQSDFGGFLDLLLDFVIYLAIPLALTAANPAALNMWACLVLLSSYIINLLSWTTLSALLEKHKLQTSGRLTSIEMPTGLVEGAETIAFYTLFLLLPTYLAPLFLIMAALVFFTASQRIWWAYHNL